MKNTIKRLFLLLLTLPLCGCFPTGQRNIGTAPKRVEGFNTDNIIIYETDIKTASVYDAKLRNPAHDELPDFFKEMGIKESMVPCAAIAIGRCDEEYELREIENDKIATTFIK